jgi:hypothetical protein
MRITTGDLPSRPTTHLEYRFSCRRLACSYVSAVRSSSRWGGHVELQAAATATGIPITVVSATAADRVVNPAPSSPRVPVRGEEAMAVISFHERQFFAGEHYNSVEPAL